MRKAIIDLQTGFWYSLLVAILSIVSVLFLIYELVVSGASSELIRIFVALDLAISYIFLADFFVGVLLSFNRKKYVRENWINLISSIPISRDIYRALRIVRFARAFRVARTTANMNSIFVLHKKKQWD